MCRCTGATPLCQHWYCWLFSMRKGRCISCLWLWLDRSMHVALFRIQGCYGRIWSGWSIIRLDSGYLRTHLSLLIRAPSAYSPFKTKTRLTVRILCYLIKRYIDKHKNTCNCQQFLNTTRSYRFIEK